MSDNLSRPSTRFHFTAPLPLKSHAPPKKNEQPGNSEWTTQGLRFWRELAKKRIAETEKAHHVRQLRQWRQLFAWRKKTELSLRHNTLMAKAQRHRELRLFQILVLACKLPGVFRERGAALLWLWFGKRTEGLRQLKTTVFRSWRTLVVRECRPARKKLRLAQAAGPAAENK